MCGIAGIVDYENERQTMSWDILKAMQDTMRRRGPDQNGIWHDRFVSLVHARLSIMDPEHGLQPMHMQEGSIVYNGELYNGGELRAELKQAGYQFQTKCDTEVVLAAYLHWKEHCVERFNGIFAFAIWDGWRKGSHGGQTAVLHRAGGHVPVWQRDQDAAGASADPRAGEP